MTAATTLEPSRKTNTTLSSGNLVATSSGAGGACSSRMLSGPCYFEGTITTLTGTPSIGIAASKWTTGVALQSGAGTLGYLATGAVQVNGVTLATIATWAAGNRIDCAIDPANRLIWFRVAGGNWNNNVANNPATGVGGIDFSSMDEGSLEAAVYASLTGNVWSMKFSAAGWAGAAPAGFASIDAVGFSAYKVASSPLIPGDAPAAVKLTATKGTEQTDCGKHFSPAGAVTKVSGTVQELGVAVADRRVDVYDRNTGELLGTTKSAGDGSWAVPCLGRATVRIVGSDPTTYNSLVFDNVPGV
jgi:hypothetical protein